MNALNNLVDAELAIERERVSLDIRLSHLKLQGRDCQDTAETRDKLLEVERWVENRIATILKDHPAYPWFSKVKGIGSENIAKCLSPLRIKAEQGYRKNPKTKQLELIDLPYATTVSDVWAFSGYSVNSDGKAMKPKEGEVLHYNKQLRSMWWRLGSSILKASLRQQCSKCGKLIGQAGIDSHTCKDAHFATVATSKFGEYYLKQKARDIDQYINKGWKVVPASELPKDNDGKKYEPEGIISEGHIHNRALRKMIKLFQACLFLTWREAEGLPATKPYPIDILGHNSIIKPWEMTDK
jgi:hypothetical protein